MAPPREIRRHGFKDSYYPGSTLNERNMFKCGELGCGLEYDAPVHWVLVEDEQQGWDHGSLGASNEFGQTIAEAKPKITNNPPWPDEHKREMDAYGVTIESVLQQLSQADAKRLSMLARDALYFKMSIPSIIANVLEASPQLSLGLLNIQPEKWNEAYKRWYELARRN